MAIITAKTCNNNINSRWQSTSKTCTRAQCYTNIALKMLK